MSRFLASLLSTALVSGFAFGQQPSGTSSAPAPGTHMNQSAIQTVGTTGAGATGVENRPSPDAGTALPTVNASNSLASSAPMPVTKTLNGGGLADPNDVADLLAPKPLNQSKLSLIGGTVRSIDQIRDKMTVKIYGSGTLHVKFDQRTHFFRDGKETTQLAVKTGDRVYLDTQLFEGKVFAKNVHVETSNSPADANGQVVAFDARNGDLTVRDQLAGSTVHFRVGQQTVIRNGSTLGNQGLLRPGALIAVRFSPRSRSTGIADQISVIAEPGTSFTYFGRVTHLDLRSGVLAIENQADGKAYEVHFDPSMRMPQNLAVGSQVTVVATFEGKDYRAQSIDVTGSPAEARADNAGDVPSARDNSKSNKDGKTKKKSSDDDDDDDPQ